MAGIEARVVSCDVFFRGKGKGCRWKRRTVDHEDNDGDTLFGFSIQDTSYVIWFLTFSGGAPPPALHLYDEQSVSQLEGWAKEFGGDYELYFAGNKVTVVTGLSDIRRILTLRPSRFKRGVVTNQTKWAAEQVG